MITALALAAILSAPVQDKIDFQLGWKQGDKFTYTVNVSSAGGVIHATGEADLTVTKVEDKGFVLSISRIEFSGTKCQPMAAGSLRVSRKGTASPDQASDASTAGVFFMFLALPEEAVEVGDAFKVSMQFEKTSAAFDGKFVSLGGSSKSLANLESEGTFVGSDGIKTTVNLKTTFDIERGTFVSHVATWQGGATVHSFKLKESGV